MGKKQNSSTPVIKEAQRTTYNEGTKLKILPALPESLIRLYTKIG